MKNITMYTGPMCNFCDAAKRLFLRNNLEYEEINISSKDGADASSLVSADSSS